jgi:outer membrane protein assembly factor BamB
VGPTRKSVASVILLTLGLPSLWPMAACLPPVAHGQDTAADDSVFFPTDRPLMQRLATAEGLIGDRRYGEGVRLLGSLLEAPEDYFFQPNRKEQVFRSLKTEAQRLLGELPAEGRESYETQFGAEARRLLEAAIDSGDIDGLAEVSRRFFHTEAGYEATDLLGVAHMERGRPLPAALCFKRIKDTPYAARQFEPLLAVKLAICWARAGQWRDAVDTLLGVAGQYPDMTLLVAGRQRKLLDVSPASRDGKPKERLPTNPTTDQLRALAWLEQVAGEPRAGDDQTGGAEWPLFRGSASRNALSQGSTPLLNRRWAVPLTNEPQIERLGEHLRQSYADQGLASVPASNPLAVGNHVFLRTAAGLMAVDFRSGKRIWNGPTDEGAGFLLDPANSDSNNIDSTIVAGWLDQRLWDDNVYGGLSSDGQSIYCVEDLAAESMTPVLRRDPFAMRRGIQMTPTPALTDRLAAYSIAAEGKLEWELNTAAGDDKSPLAGAFFLGPPLPLGGRLYVLAEIKGEIRLIALHPKTDPDSGQKKVEVEWSQQLAMVEQSIAEDGSRRLAGAIPSFADGILVCPTSAGAVVAVDLTTRALLWGYRYQRTGDGTARERAMLSRFRDGGSSSDREHWCDATVTIAEGRVLVTPAEVEGSGSLTDLYCLNLLDGKLLWKQPRDAGLYLACVHDGAAVIVGAGSVRAYSLDRGQLKWSLPLPTGSVPSGRGYFNGKQYFLPLSSAEVAAIDVESGAIVSRAKSRTGQVPGNLVCHDGAVISQNVGWLECFYQLDDLENHIARTLKEKPNDATALALKAELALNDSQLEDALPLLRKSFAERASPHTRQLLIESLLEGLRTDFARFRKSIPELERLIQTPAQELMFLRELAGGLQRSGETRAAFDTCLKIVDLPGNSDELDRVDAHLSVRRDRWVQARMKLLRDTADADELETIDGQLRKRLDAAKAAEGPEALRSFVHFFGSQPIAEEARELLVARLGDGALPLEREQLLRQLAESSDPARARSATAQWLRLLDANKKLDEAGSLAERLMQDPDAECLNGKTARQLIAELTKGSEKIEAPFEKPWPTGRVRREDLKQASLGSPNRVFALDMRGVKGPFFEHSTIELDNQSQAIACRDGIGNEKWRVSLADRGDGNSYPLNYSLSHTRADGHLLVTSLGFQLLAIDTLGSDKENARILWRKDLTDVLPNTPRHMGIQPRVINMPWGMHRFMANDAFGRPVGSIGPVTTDSIVYQRQRQLLAVHPITGKTLWTRSGIQPGSDIFGDDELLFVTPPGSSEALVVRAADGQELGRRFVPKVEQRLATVGRKVAVWQIGHPRCTLKMRDIWTEQDLWEQQYQFGAKPWPIEDRAVAVMQIDGKFAIVNLPDGKPEIEATLKGEPSLTEIYVFHTPDRYLLVTNRPWSNKDGDNVQPLPGGGFANPLVNGYMYGFDRTTRELVFTTPIEGRSLTFNQPPDLPVMMFAAQIYRQRSSGRSETAPQAAILCIDKRTGRVAYEEKLGGPVNMIELSGDAAHRQMTIRTNRNAVKLTFTDDAWPTEAEKAAAAPSLPVRASRTLGRGFERWLKGQSDVIRNIDPSN